MAKAKLTTKTYRVVSSSTGDFDILITDESWPIPRVTITANKDLNYDMLIERIDGDINSMIDLRDALSEAIAMYMKG